MQAVNENYSDVIIVGAGPAGATLGYELARRGTKVVILEKERLPRYKCCAGVVSVKSANLLGCDISPVTHRIINGARITYKLGSEFIKRYDSPIGYMVMRDEFDQFLTSRAQNAGAILCENQKVCSLQATEGGVEVSTTRDSFSGKILIGADGATSIVAKTFDLAPKRQAAVAIEAEVLVSEEDISRWDSLAGLDLGIARGGYGWVFPKRHILSVGVGAPVQHAKDLRAYHQRLLKSLNLRKGDIAKLKGHLVPMYQGKTPVQRGRILLLGDAAALVDPMSGEGILNAIKSAQLAAPVIATQLARPYIDLCEYQQAVETDILPDLRIAKRMHRLFTWFPHTSFLLLSKSNHAWRAGAGVASGRRTYVDIRNRLGPFRFLLGL